MACNLITVVMMTSTGSDRLVCRQVPHKDSRLHTDSRMQCRTFWTPTVNGIQRAIQKAAHDFQPTTNATRVLAEVGKHVHMHVPLCMKLAYSCQVAVHKMGFVQVHSGHMLVLLC